MGTYVIGDRHGNFEELILFAIRLHLTEDDNLIVLGDMGLCWRKDRQDLDKFIYRWEKLCYFKPMLYFIDGNHENFDLLKSFPEGRISEHIQWLPRGTVKEFEGKRCLCIGGADSVDKFRRTEHLSWWEDEQITQEDIDKCPEGEYDYVFSHACPYSIFKENMIYLQDPQFIGEDFDHTSETMLDKLKNKINFKNWWFGHYHKDIELDGGFRCLYNVWEELV